MCVAVTVEELKPHIDEEFPDEAIALGPVWEGTEKGWQEEFAHVHRLGVFELTPVGSSSLHNWQVKARMLAM